MDNLKYLVILFISIFAHNFLKNIFAFHISPLAGATDTPKASFLKATL